MILKKEVFARINKDPSIEQLAQGLKDRLGRQFRQELNYLLWLGNRPTVDQLGVEDWQSGLPSGLKVPHQLAEDIRAVLAGLQLVEELVEGQLVPGQARLQLAD